MCNKRQVTEIYDRSQEKWCMLDPTTNGYLVDEKGTILSLSLIHICWIAAVIMPLMQWMRNMTV